MQGHPSSELYRTRAHEGQRGGPSLLWATRTTLSGPQPRPARAASANRNAQRFSAFPLETTRSGARALTAQTVWLEDFGLVLLPCDGVGGGFPPFPFRDR